MAKRRANGKGCIYPRRGKEGGATQWIAQFTKNGKRHSFSAKTPQEAKQKLKAAIREAERDTDNKVLHGIVGEGGAEV